MSDDAVGCARTHRTRRDNFLAHDIFADDGLKMVAARQQQAGPAFAHEQTGTIDLAELETTIKATVPHPKLLYLVPTVSPSTTGHKRDALSSVLHARRGARGPQHVRRAYGAGIECGAA